MSWFRLQVDVDRVRWLPPTRSAGLSELLRFHHCLAKRSHFWEPLVIHLKHQAQACFGKAASLIREEQQPNDHKQSNAVVILLSIQPHQSQSSPINASCVGC
jgi:hypothetical protein